MRYFHKIRPVRCTRKEYECEQCGKTIAAGSAAVHHRGCYDGDLYQFHEHVECDVAAHDFADRRGLFGEDFPTLQYLIEDFGFDFDIDDLKWMVANHPIVAERLGWDVRLKELEADAAGEGAA